MKNRSTCPLSSCTARSRAGLPAILAAVLAGASAQAAMSDEKLMAVRDGFEQRRDAAFERVRGQPLRIAPVREPLEKGRSVYARHFAYSIVDFAMRAFWLDEQTDTANRALMRYADFFIADRALRNDRDTFYWPADVLGRIVEFYGRNGSIAPGRLKAETENRLLEMMWLYAKENSKVDSLDEVYALYRQWDWGASDGAALPASAEIKRSRTWDVIESENHHVQKFTTLWHISKLLSESENYREKRYDDGHLAAEHLAAWSAYAAGYCRERARKALFVEMANCYYVAHTLKGIYNIHDFTADKTLRDLTGRLLDLYFASWGQEQIDGVRGGGKSRIYQGGIDLRGESPVRNFMWFYAGIGEEPALQSELLTILTSRYRLPLLVLDLILDVEGRGSYEVIERPLGLAADGLNRNPHYRLRTDFGGIVRYSYCTPDFVMGLPLVELRPVAAWTAISSQNRWQGVIFPGHRDARIVPQCEGVGGPTYNQQWGIQRKGTMIVQRMPGERAVNTGGMRVWVGQAGLTGRGEEQGWAFAEAKGAFAAVRPARGGFRWEEPSNSADRGRWMVFEDGRSPAILEVARKVDFPDFKEFRRAVLGLPLEWHGAELAFHGLSGSEFRFWADGSAGPTVDGKAIDYHPPHAFMSPFVQSVWDSGLVVLKKDERRLELDFR